MKVRVIRNVDTLTLRDDKIYDVLSVEKGWYRIMTELDDDYLFPPEIFEIVSITKEEANNELKRIIAESIEQHKRIEKEAKANGTWQMGLDSNNSLFAEVDEVYKAKFEAVVKAYQRQFKTLQ